MGRIPMRPLFRPVRTCTWADHDGAHAEFHLFGDGTEEFEQARYIRREHGAQVMRAAAATNALHNGADIAPSLLVRMR